MTSSSIPCLRASMAGFSPVVALIDEGEQQRRLSQVEASLRLGRLPGAAGRLAARHAQQKSGEPGIGPILMRSL
ncbi:hypothetical protein Mchl_0176 [Methylorubrum extorquens CM4]|uniref:Uncharacterized protein n=1 Tax=Methylorubrum extorquens (strain CM4 / NCIMB 13688) TaxID=440085 RepID=B7L1M8_METC4|nr:hypothetical protein Mchl_0176 [Methylorubrum extorquens CM4]